MRIDNSLPALIMAAVLGTALIGCQRQSTPATGSGVGVPLMHGERFGAPPGPPTGAERPAEPGAGGGLGPHYPPNHPAIRRPDLIAT